MADYVVPFIIGGEERRGGKTFDVVSPDTGKLVHQCALATQEDAAAAIDAAARAFPKWRDTTPGTRRDVLLKAAEVMNRRRAELAEYMKEAVGAAQQWADFNIDVAIDTIKDVAGRVSAVTGTVPSLSDPSLGAMILKEPYGVVLAIAPWYVLPRPEYAAGPAAAILD